MTPNTKPEGITRKQARAAKHVWKERLWVQRAGMREGMARIKNEDAIRDIVLQVLRGADGTSKSVLFAAVYRAFACPGHGSQGRKTLRVSIDLVLQKLYLEGVIFVDSVRVPGDCQLDVPPYKRDLTKVPRTVSMIYLRPTNDMPVNRVAARVIGPVWGSSALL
jgi:hypothetical protein